MVFRSYLMLAPVLAALAGPVAAETIQDRVIRQLDAEGYTRVEVSRTFLGRVRMVATAPDARREIVISPSTGTILRDYEVRGERATPRFARSQGAGRPSTSGGNQDSRRFGIETAGAASATGTSPAIGTAVQADGEAPVTDETDSALTGDPDPVETGTEVPSGPGEGSGAGTADPGDPEGADAEAQDDTAEPEDTGTEATDDGSDDQSDAE